MEGEQGPKAAEYDQNRWYYKRCGERWRLHVLTDQSPDTFKQAQRNKNIKKIHWREKVAPREKDRAGENVEQDGGAGDGGGEEG